MTWRFSVFNRKHASPNCDCRVKYHDRRFADQPTGEKYSRNGKQSAQVSAHWLRQRCRRLGEQEVRRLAQYTYPRTTISSPTMNRMYVCERNRPTSEKVLPGARRKSYMHVHRFLDRKPLTCITLRRCNYAESARLESCSRDAIGSGNIVVSGVCHDRNSTAFSFDSVFSPRSCCWPRSGWSTMRHWRSIHGHDITVTECFWWESSVSLLSWRATTQSVLGRGRQCCAEQREAEFTGSRDSLIVLASSENSQHIGTGYPLSANGCWVKVVLEKQLTRLADHWLKTRLHRIRAST